MPPETVSVAVELPPDSGPPTTDQSSPSVVVVGSTTGPSGDASMADLLARVRALEEKNESMRQQLERVESAAFSAIAEASAAAIVATESEAETTPDPESETPEEIIVPESSDDGPKAVPEKAKPKKPAWHRWI
jgi:cell pole-organizing protein PopZ